MDGIDNIIHMMDSDGNDCPFEFLDLIQYEGKEYVILLPIDGDEVVILEVEGTDDPENESYIGVEDESVLEAVFGIFRERFKDEFNFTD